MNAVDELIRLYAKQLKIPSFAEYREVLRQADPSAGFADLLLELMKAETASRQENQNRRRLKAAADGMGKFCKSNTPVSVGQ